MSEKMLPGRQRRDHLPLDRGRLGVGDGRSPTRSISGRRRRTGRILLTGRPSPCAHVGFRPRGCARVLGLASGGGQQMPILTAAGARCTVLDYTPAQLDADVSSQGGRCYGIEVVHADMTQALPFSDASFDLVVSPVLVLLRTRGRAHLARGSRASWHQGATLLSGLEPRHQLHRQ